MKRNVLIILCLLSLTLATCGGKATATPNATQITPVAIKTGTIVPISTSTPTMEAYLSLKDVKYKKPTNSKYFEMDIPKNGSITCTIAGKAVVYTDMGDGLLQIAYNTKTILVTEQDVKDFDTTHIDGWVQILNLGKISIGYVDDRWKADWLSGCPTAAKTPGP